MKTKKRLVYLAMTAVIVTGVCYGVRLWANQSPQATVTVGSSSPSKASVAAPLRISTTYFSTVLPSEFSIKRQLATASGQTKLTLVASTSATSDEQIAITIGTTPSEGMQATGDYNLRATEKSTYTPTTIESTATLTAFRRIIDSAELTVFWGHGNEYAEISCSTGGGAPYAELRALCSGIVNQWEWH